MGGERNIFSMGLCKKLLIGTKLSVDLIFRKGSTFNILNANALREIANISSSSCHKYFLCI